MLTVEALRATHAEELYELLRSPALYHYIPGAPPGRVEDVAARFARLEAGSTKSDEVWLNWVARVEGTPVATLQSTLLPGQRALVGYVVFEPFWNQGLGTSCVRWILRELFERTSTQTAQAEIDPRNLASIRIVQKLGMREKQDALREPSADRVFELDRAHFL